MKQRHTPIWLEAHAGHLSKRISDRYKHISEKAARKASDELVRVRTVQRDEARANLKRQEELSGREDVENPSTATAHQGEASLVH
jgi:hypothetical protein